MLSDRKARAPPQLRLWTREQLKGQIESTPDRTQRIGRFPGWLSVTGVVAVELAVEGQADSLNERMNPGHLDSISETEPATTAVDSQPDGLDNFNRLLLTRDGLADPIKGGS